MVEWGRAAARFERPVLIAAVALLAFGVVTGEAVRREEWRETRKIAASALEAASAARSEARAALAAIIAPDTLARASTSVYLILVNGTPRGTAFVVDRKNGLLATAAHTAEGLPIGRPGDTVVILNRSTRTPIPVVGRKIHGGYGAFRAVIEDYQPIRKSSSIYDPQAAPIRDLAFDAALLRVNPIDRATGDNRLGPDLPLAPESKLLALGPGSPIAVIGYPYDTLDSGLTPDAAISRAERGVVSAMIAPLDSAAEVENPGLANLIIHRLSTAGGSSGSPLINADGEVVGLHTHGVESTSSNGDSAAQRADVLHDLLSDTREQERVAEIFVPAWRRTLSYWARASDVLPWSFYKEYAVPSEKPAPSVGSIDYVAKTPFARVVAKSEFGAGVDAFAVDAEDVGPGKKARTARFVIREPGEFAAAWVSVDRSRNTVLFAYDYSMRQRNAACRITTYWRKRGETRLAVARARASFEQFIPTLPDGGVEAYQIVHKRDVGCDPTNRSFFTGSIAWGAPAEAMVAAAQGGQSVALLRMAQAAHVTFNKAFTCTFQSDGDEGCAAPEYVALDPGADPGASGPDSAVGIGSAPQLQRADLKGE